MRPFFWENYSLGELNTKEWEALCDGCAQCCLIREVDNNQVTVFNLTCELLDANIGRCHNYEKRLELMPHCHQLKPSNVPDYNWLPDTCAYRLLHNKKPIPKWHPLITGSRSQMRKKNITVCKSAVPANQVPKRKHWQHIIQVWNI